jgi:hypothetical protein
VNSYSRGNKIKSTGFLAGFFLFLCLILTLSVRKEGSINHVVAGSPDKIVYLPVINNGFEPECRFGVNIIQNPANLSLEKLRLGWYLNYSTNKSSLLSSSMAYVPVVRLSQTGPNAEDFSYTPSGTALLDAIAANPQADWLIGNEPDRIDYQDDVEPHVYAAAYAELYGIIKTADPSARIFAGTIVQPTPLRLQYLDIVLDSYKQQNGGAKMPVDGWSIHNFILNEVSCDYDPGNCWGADVPPGVNANFGEILNIDDNDDIDRFKQRIVNFRQWMADRGYGGFPLTVSEYGILMPDYLGFDDDRVNTFMNATFDYMRSATDPLLGDPNDNYHLVQTWSWFSTGAPEDQHNGYLFEGEEGVYPWGLSDMGKNYANYTKPLVPEIDLYPSAFTSAPASLTAPANVTLTVRVANSGTNVFAKNFAVRFYNGDPQNGGTQIGMAQPLSLKGCGHNATATIVWTNVPQGTYQLYAVVDANSELLETNEQNNSANLQVTVGN